MNYVLYVGYQKTENTICLVYIGDGGGGGGEAKGSLFVIFWCIVDVRVGRLRV